MTSKGGSLAGWSLRGAKAALRRTRTSDSLCEHKVHQALDSAWSIAQSEGHVEPLPVRVAIAGDGEGGLLAVLFCELHLPES